MSAQHRVLVVGGGYAGVMAALRVARTLRSRGEVCLINEGLLLTERIRLHEHLVRGRHIHHSLSDLLRGTGVRLIDARVAALDVPEQRAVLADGRICLWDRVLLALGSATDDGGIPGVRPHAQLLNPPEAAANRDRLASLASVQGRVAVCGGGLTGVELAAEIAEAYPALRVTLLTRGEVGPMVSPKGRAYLRRTLATLGVRLIEGAEIERMEPQTVVADSSSADFDLCFWAGGFKAPPLLRTAGLLVNHRGQARVDPWLRAVGHEGVFVAGDAGTPDQTPGHVLAMGCKTAMPMAERAAANLLASLGHGSARAFDFLDPLLCISLGRRHGLVQFKDREGRPGPRIITGRAGAMIKEFVCRGAMWALHSVRLGLPFYWPETGRVRQEPF